MQAPFASARHPRGFSLPRPAGHWQVHGLWLIGLVLFGFGVPAIFSSWLGLSRNWFVAVYLAAVLPVAYAYFQTTGIDLVAVLRDEGDGTTRLLMRNRSVVMLGRRPAPALVRVTLPLLDFFDFLYVRQMLRGIRRRVERAVAEAGNQPGAPPAHVDLKQGGLAGPAMAGAAGDAIVASGA